ncbi:MAG: endonuclease domain-containing protein [Terriglobia bacterium]
MMALVDDQMAVVGHAACGRCRHSRASTLAPTEGRHRRRVAVELDGAQHLADPVAYRRDRRKDQLLQENGYLVLRFLAEDVGRELDLVLDGISRALSRRGFAEVQSRCAVSQDG